MIHKQDVHLLSPLSQLVERDGHAVRVDIYGNGSGKWTLETVDRYGNSSVWSDPFETDQFALDEAMRRIESDGISSLVGTQPGEPS